MDPDISGVEERRPYYVVANERYVAIGETIQKKVFVYDKQNDFTERIYATAESETDFPSSLAMSKFEYIFICCSLTNNS